LPIFTKIHPVTDELTRADRHNETKRRSSWVRERA